MSKEINDLKQQIMWLQNQNASLINRQESLRDNFAGLAMQKIIDSYDSPVTKRSIAIEAYDYADAMLAERDKRND